MEREITYTLQIFMADPTDEVVQVLAMDPGDLRYVLEIEPGYILQMT